MSTEEIQEATETTFPRSGHDNSSSSGRNTGGGGSSVPGLPQGSRGKIILPSELSVIPPSSCNTGILATHEDVDEGELDDKISELRDKNNDNKLLDMNVISSSSCNSKEGKSYVDQLTKEQYDDMCYSFSLFDTDGDGKISKNDILHASKMFGTQRDVTTMLGDHGIFHRICFCTFMCTLLTHTYIRIHK